jgi:hypothetical protein
VDKPEGCNCISFYRTTGHSDIYTKGWLKTSLKHGWDIYEHASNLAGEKVPLLNIPDSPIAPPPLPAVPMASGYGYVQPVGYYAPNMPVAAPVYQTVYTEQIQGYALGGEQYSSPSPGSPPQPLTQGASAGIGGIQGDAAGKDDAVKAVCVGIIITNIHFKMTKEDLDKLLETKRVGHYQTMKFKIDKSGHAVGSAIVNFYSSRDAKTAVAALDNVIWRGRPLKVRVDKNRSPSSVTNPPVANGST